MVAERGTTNRLVISGRLILSNVSAMNFSGRISGNRRVFGAFAEADENGADGLMAPCVVLGRGVFPFRTQDAGTLMPGRTTGIE